MSNNTLLLAFAVAFGCVLGWTVGYELFVKPVNTYFERLEQNAP